MGDEQTEGGMPQADDPRIPGDFADRYYEKPRRLADVIEDFVQTLDYKKQSGTIDRILSTRDLGNYDRAAMIAISALADNQCVPELDDLRTVLDIADRHPHKYARGRKAARGLLGPSKKRFSHWYAQPRWNRRGLVRFDNPSPRSQADMAVDRIADMLRKAGKTEAAEELLLLSCSDSSELGLGVVADELHKEQIPLSVEDAEEVLAARLGDEGGGEVETGLALVVEAAHRAGQTWVELEWEPYPQDYPMPEINEYHLADLIRHRQEQLEEAEDLDAVLAMNILANAGEPLAAYLLGFYCSVRDHLPVSFKEAIEVARYADYSDGSDVGDVVETVLAPARKVTEKILPAARQAIGGEVSDYDRDLLSGSVYDELVDWCVDDLHDHPVALHLDKEEIETAVSLVRSFALTEEGEDNEEVKARAQTARLVLEDCERRYQASRTH